MTRQVERTLNLPRLEDALKEFSDQMPEIEAAQKDVNEMTQAFEKIAPSNADQIIDDGTELHCKEMDEVYKQALRAHKDMIDLGYNVESRHAGGIFEPAARFLEIAMNASKSKNEQKLKTLKLRMDRQKLDHELQADTINGTIDGSEAGGFVASRNDLLKDLVGKLRDSRVPKK